MLVFKFIFASNRLRIAKNENLIEKTFGNTGCVSAQLFHYLISVVNVVVVNVVVINFVFVVVAVAAHKQV